MKKRQTKTLKEELRQQILNLKLAVADILKCLWNLKGNLKGATCIYNSRYSQCVYSSSNS